MRAWLIAALLLSSPDPIATRLSENAWCAPVSHRKNDRMRCLTFEPEGRWRSELTNFEAPAAPTTGGAWKMEGGALWMSVGSGEHRQVSVRLVTRPVRGLLLDGSPYLAHPWPVAPPDAGAPPR